MLVLGPFRWLEICVSVLVLKLLLVTVKDLYKRQIFFHDSEASWILR